MNDTDARQIYDMVYQYVATPISVLGFLGNFLILFVWCRETYHPTYFILVILSVGRNLYMIASHLCHFRGQRPCYQQHSILHIVAFCLQFFVATGSLFMTVVHYFWMFHVQQSRFLTSRYIGVAMVVQVLWGLLLTALPHVAKSTDMKVENYFSLFGVALPAICQCALSIVMSCKYHALCRLQTDSSRSWSSDADWWRMRVATLERAPEVQTKSTLTYLSTRKTSSAMPNRRAPFALPIPPMLRDQPSDPIYNSTQRQSFSYSKRRHISGLPLVDTRAYSIGSVSKRFQPPIVESRARSAGAGAHSLTSGVRASSIGTTLSFSREKARRQLGSRIARLAISKAVIVISFVPFFLHCISLLGYMAVFFLPDTNSLRPKRYLFHAAFITGLYIDNTYQGFFFLILFKSFRKPFRHLFYCWNRDRKTSTRVGIEDGSAPSKENWLVSKVDGAAGCWKGKVKAVSSVPLTGNSTTFVGSSKSSGDSSDRSSELSSSHGAQTSDSSDYASSSGSSGSSAS